MRLRFAILVRSAAQVHTPFPGGKRQKNDFGHTLLLGHFLPHFPVGPLILSGHLSLFGPLASNWLSVPGQHCNSPVLLVFGLPC